MTDHTDTEDIGAVVEQAEELCQLHDHITRVLRDLHIPDDLFSDQYTKDSSDQFDLTPMLKFMLYKEVNQYSQREACRKLEGLAYVRQRLGFGIDEMPTRGAYSYTKRNRFSHEDRQKFLSFATDLRELAIEYDLVSEFEEAPKMHPDDVTDKTGPTVEEVDRQVQIARDRLFSEFVTGRADNAKYSDQVFWQAFGYLASTTHGKSNLARRYKRVNNYMDAPHSDTFLRTVKKLGEPDPQTGLDDYVGEIPTEKWQRIRKTLLDPFDRAMQNLFEETDFEGHIREPVNVAIDVTPWQFHPSPWDENEDPKPDYPTMVSGTKEQDVRAYKFATVTVVGEDTPIVLGVEPVKEDSTWETDDGVTRTPLSDVVERLLSTAEEYVDIHKVFCDREFSSHWVRGVIDRKGLTYVIPKPGQAKQDLEDIENVKQHETADMGVRVNPLTVDGRTHDVAFMYIPSESGSYNIFTTNAEVPPGRIQGLTEQYRDRWMIEIEYRTIKQNFLPLTTSTDYRVRLFHFIAAVIMYNVWRVTNVLLRTVYGYERNLGDSPLVPAGEIPEVVRMTLGFSTGIG